MCGGLVQACGVPVELLAADGEAEAQAEEERDLRELGWGWGGRALGQWREGGKGTRR